MEFSFFTRFKDDDRTFQANLVILAEPRKGRRFGPGARYDWSEKLALGAGYTFLWNGDHEMDLKRGPLAGRVSGTYENMSTSFIKFYLKWKF